MSNPEDRKFQGMENSEVIKNHSPSHLRGMENTGIVKKHSLSLLQGMENTAIVKKHSLSQLRGMENTAIVKKHSLSQLQGMENTGVVKKHSKKRYIRQNIFKDLPFCPYFYNKSGIQSHIWPELVSILDYKWNGNNLIG